MFPDSGDLARIPGDYVASGADLEPGTLLAAYRAGIFPMPGRDSLDWWCPERRGVLPTDGLRVSRSLRRSMRRFEVRVDSAFAEVIRACAERRTEGNWIDEDVIEAYSLLHTLGWAHSVEAWQDGRLVGGLYGVSIGGLFAGESMFSVETDASKVALVALVERIRDGQRRLLDVQWQTPHLASLGVVEVPRAEYLVLLRAALNSPTPDWDF